MDEKQVKELEEKYKLLVDRLKEERLEQIRQQNHPKGLYKEYEQHCKYKQRVCEVLLELVGEKYWD